MKKLLAIALFFGLVSMSFAQVAERSGQPTVKDPSNPLFIYGPTSVESANTISESFEGVTFPPTNWAQINVPSGSTGWSRITTGITPIPGWNGGLVTPTPDGNGGSAMTLMSYQFGGSTSNDNWLVTPQLMNVGATDTLSFWVRMFSDLYADNLDIKISTTVNNNTAAFNVNVASISFAASAADTGWRYVSYVIGNLVPAGSNIYIGFREWVLDNVNDGNALFIDVVSAGGGVVPVELVSFNANVSDKNVHLSWTTATEVNNSGFEVQKSAGEEFTTIAFVDGHGSTTELNNYSFTDKNVTEGIHSYRLKQIDFDGSFEYSNVIEADVKAPVEFSLGQNYPNPFNPGTTISFALKVDSKVTMKIFNLLGQEVATLINQELTAGSQKFEFNASELNSGVYFYRLDAQGIDGSSFTSTKKMILTK